MATSLLLLLLLFAAPARSYLDLGKLRRFHRLTPTLPSGEAFQPHHSRQEPRVEDDGEDDDQPEGFGSLRRRRQLAAGLSQDTGPSPPPPLATHQTFFSVNITAYGTELTLDLTLNENILPKERSSRPGIRDLEHCFYHGHVRGYEGGGADGVARDEDHEEHYDDDDEDDDAEDADGSSRRSAAKKQERSWLG